MSTAIAQQIARTLAQHAEIELAFVFGSAARGALRPDSDVDVAVLAAPTRNKSLRKHYKPIILSTPVMLH